MSHCDYCRRGKKRRALRALLLEQPNMTSTRAAETLGLNRPNTCTIRAEMVRRGCISPRTVTPHRQAMLERNAAASVLAHGRGHAVARWWRAARPIGSCYVADA